MSSERREWRVVSSDYEIESSRYDTEDGIRVVLREMRILYRGKVLRIESRIVGPWEPAEGGEATDAAQ